MQELTYLIHDYDCDALGHLYTGNYIRLAEDAARQFWHRLLLPEAGLEDAAIGVGPDSMLLELDRPLHAGDRVGIKNMMVDMEDGAARVLHTFRTGEGEPVASCQTRWTLNCGGMQGRERMQALLTQGLIDAERPTWPEAPAPSGPPEGMVERIARVGWRDVSPRRRAFMGAYMDYMVDSAIFAGEQYGWDFDDSMKAGFAFVARRQWVDVFTPVGLGEALRVQTWLYGLRRTTAYRHYMIRREESGKVVARGTTYWAAVDVTTGRPTRIPAAFKRDLAAHIA